MTRAESAHTLTFAFFSVPPPDTYRVLRLHCFSTGYTRVYLASRTQRLYSRHRAQAMSCQLTSFVPMSVLSCEKPELYCARGRSVCWQSLTGSQMPPKQLSRGSGPGKLVAVSKICLVMSCLLCARSEASPARLRSLPHLLGAACQCGSNKHRWAAGGAALAAIPTQT